ncbi:hypothetical protein ACFP1Z_32485 [Streptomyces gamaensis]|uniref:Uncharacterized protein n=1 Tax=Streptomyces gamaensis TaxID=1763542 RepID=A0ABW0ZC16_9ACTN
MEPIERSYTSLTALHDAYGLTPAERAAVTEAYEVFRAHHGPFITSVAVQMLPDLHADADVGRTIVFLGRDGHSFAAAVRALEPGFFARHCKEAVLSRVVVDAALQDLETHRGERFPAVDGFRRTRNRVPPETVPGAYRHLTSYLRAMGIPAGLPGSTVTVVDSSFKGTVQELLSATYPQTDFQGRYAFFGASPADPHPGTKHGYVIDLPPERTAEGRGLPFDELPDDPALTFASGVALSVIEDTLHGPLDTPLRISALGPEQPLQRSDGEPLMGFNPVVVPGRYRSPAVREAAKAAALLAVFDHAAETARRRDAGENCEHELMQARREFTRHVRAWIRRDTGADPALKTVLDSLVHRTEWPAIARLHSALASAGISEEAAAPLWQHFESLPTLHDKRAFADATPTALTPLMLMPDHELAAHQARLQHASATLEPAAAGPDPGCRSDAVQRLTERGAPPDAVERAQQAAREDAAYARIQAGQAGRRLAAFREEIHGADREAQRRTTLTGHQRLTEQAIRQRILPRQLPPPAGQPQGQAVPRARAPQQPVKRPGHSY